MSDRQNLGSAIRKYLRIMRLDHWIKQFFIVPGCICALFLTSALLTWKVAGDFLIGFLATSLIASANYVINEYLDAQFDRFHPTKKFRSIVSEDVRPTIVWLMYAILTALGLGVGWFINLPFFLSLLWLWVMGILYNVKPFRTKDIVILDVLSESVNNAIRFLLGWFLISRNTLPPSSILLGYWMAGAFLMATKRFSEYRMIGDPELAGKYRRSFRFYSEKLLLITSFFYAMSSVFFIGLFLIKYRVELILFVPVFMGLFCYYFWIAFKEDSAAQKPEKLFRERGLLLYLLILVVLFVILLYVDIPDLQIFTSNTLISIS